MDQGSPRVSIVTVVRNGAATIERAIRSVLGQTCPAIEYIIVDGASTDGTQEIIRRYEGRLARWISEPDRGISDAFNKGVALANGACIGLLNADDWMEPDQVEIAVGALEASGADFVFGDLIFHDAAGCPVHRITGDPHYARHIRSRMPEVNHPTLLARRSMYERVGPFHLTYKAAMDYDWLLRAHLAGCRGHHEPRILGHMTLAGVSDRSYVRALREVRDIAIRHGQPPAQARALFAYRMLKGASQRGLKRLAPEPLYGLVRGLINRSYRPSRARAGD